MTDATTRQHSRPHLDADPLEVALAAWRRGQPCDLPTLTRAGAITIGKAHDAWRAGLWEPEQCEAAGAGRGAPCPVCLGTRYEWSERHAELLAYAGEESISLDDEQSLRVALRGAGWVAGFVEELRRWSDLAPLAAAWGVAMAWAWASRELGPCECFMRSDYAGTCPSCESSICTLDAVWRYLCDPSESSICALDAVWRYLCDPSDEALRGLSWGADANPPNRLAVSATGLAGDVEAWSLVAIVRDAASDLGEEATSRAAREGVRRWAGRVWGVDP